MKRGGKCKISATRERAWAVRRFWTHGVTDGTLVVCVCVLRCMLPMEGYNAGKLRVPCSGSGYLLRMW